MRALIVLFLFLPTLALAQSLAEWQRQFPLADFSVSSVPFSDIEFDGNGRDSIPPIYNPTYRPVSDVTDIGPYEPVLSVAINGDARAYPLRLMLWHEIVNEVIGGRDVLVSYYPLCNSGVVWDRDVNGRVLRFGNTGHLRHLDMVMFDHETESWWQQFSGTAIIGALTGARMAPLPSRQESMQSFSARHPDGLVLVPLDPTARPYGLSPFRGMDGRKASRRFSKWPLPKGVAPLHYIVVAGDRAWPLSRLRDAGRIAEAGLTLTWTPGRNSLHDTQIIADGRDIGIVEVRDHTGASAVHDVTFAFAFAAFLPDGTWMLGGPP